MTEPEDTSLMDTTMPLRPRANKAPRQHTPDAIDEPEIWDDNEANIEGHVKSVNEETQNKRQKQIVTPSTKKQRRQPGYALKTEVRTSNIPGAGKGLFMLETARKGDRVATYVGEVLTPEQAKDADSDYIVKVNSKVYLDAKNVVKDNQGRYVNYGGPGLTNNARLGSGRTYTVCKKTGRPYISIIATKTIQPREEVRMPYGRGWVWPWQKRAQNTHLQHMQVPAHIEPDEQQARNEDSRQQACSNIKLAITSMVETAVKMGRHSKRRIQALWNTAIHWALKGRAEQSESAVERLVRMVAAKSEDMQNIIGEQRNMHHGGRGRGSARRGGRGRGSARYGGRGRGRGRSRYSGRGMDRRANGAIARSGACIIKDRRHSAAPAMRAMSDTMAAHLAKTSQQHKNNATSAQVTKTKTPDNNELVVAPKVALPKSQVKQQVTNAKAIRPDTHNEPRTAMRQVDKL